MNDVFHDIAKEIREKSKNVAFLSEVNLSSSSLEYIRGHVYEILENLPSNDADFCILQAFTLVDIGCQFYEENRYWPYLEEQERKTSAGERIKCNQQKTRERYMEAFSAGIKELGLNEYTIKWKESDDEDIFFQSLTSSRIRNIDKILVHTFVPDYKFDDFFDFSLTFYKHILINDVSNIDEALQNLSLFMREYNEEIYEADIDIPNPQKLLKCTRYALSDEFSYPFMRRILEFIDSYYNNEDIVGSDSNRFVAAFESWMARQGEKRGSRKGSQGNHLDKPRFLRSVNGKIQLFIPQYRCNKNDELVLESGNQGIKSFKPNIYKFGNEYISKEFYINLHAGDYEISPFEKFTVKLGEKQIYENKIRDFITFNNEGKESKSIVAGYWGILFRGNPEVFPEDIITDCSEGIVTIFVQEGDEVRICGKQFIIKDDNPVDRIEIKSIEGMEAEIDGSSYRVVSENRATFVVSVKTESAIVLSLWDGKCVRKKKFLLQQEGGIGCTKFRQNFLLSDFFNEPALVSIDVRENDALSLCKDEFFYYPGFSFEFDRKYYITEPEGRLTTSEGIVQSFDSREERIQFHKTFQNKDVEFIINTPSVYVSFDGESWYGPQIHEFSILKLYTDSLFVKLNGLHSIRIYGKNEIEREVRDDYTVFNLIPWKEEMDNNVKKLVSEYQLFISIDSKPKQPFIRVFTHNTYEVQKSDRSVEVKGKANIPAKAIFTRFIGGRRETVGEQDLCSGVNCLNISESDRIMLSIVEQDPSTKKYDVDIKQEILGEESLLEPYGEKWLFVFGMNCVLLRGGKIWELWEDYNSKKRFSPWMKDSAAESTFENLITKKLTQ